MNLFIVEIAFCSIVFFDIYSGKWSAVARPLRNLKLLATRAKMSTEIFPILFVMMFKAIQIGH